MKRLLGMLLVLFVIYLGIQYLFNLFEKGQSNEYVLNNGNTEFKILETSNFQNNNSNYLFEMEFNDKILSFQIEHDYKKISSVIKKIEYYKSDNYECLLPIFRDNLILIDVMCYTNNNLTYYYNLKGKDNNLDNFVNKIEHYDIKQFTNSQNYETISKIKVYKENLADNHYIGITSYKGIYNISKEFNSTVYNISLFDNDIYNQKLGVFVDNYYLVADYNEQYEFYDFNVVNLVTLDTFTITSNIPISIDSYIQGVVDGKVYLYDKDNRMQYEINIAKKNIIQYSSNSISHYDKGNWTTITVSDANNETKFVYDELDYANNNYQRIDKVGNVTGYYYLYKKNNGKYDVYRINVQNKNGLTYLFSTETIDNIYYIDNYVYFIDQNKIKVFNSEFGLKTLIEYNELQFNKNINFSIYIK